MPSHPHSGIIPLGGGGRAQPGGLGAHLRCLSQPPPKEQAGHPSEAGGFLGCLQKFHTRVWDVNHALGLENVAESKRTVRAPGRGGGQTRPYLLYRGAGAGGQVQTGLSHRLADFPRSLASPGHHHRLRPQHSRRPQPCRMRGDQEGQGVLPPNGQWWPRDQRGSAEPPRIEG